EHAEHDIQSCEYTGQSQFPCHMIPPFYKRGWDKTIPVINKPDVRFSGASREPVVSRRCYSPRSLTSGFLSIIDYFYISSVLMSQHLYFMFILVILIMRIYCFVVNWYYANTYVQSI